ncbi:MAG: c-type cytochrome [Blastocatellia bacterium]
MRKPLSFAAVLMAMAMFISVAWRDLSAQPAKGKGGGDAAAIYQKECAKCHGADGKGIKSLEPPDFTDAKWQASHTDKQLSAGIAKGEGVMPAYKDKLSAAQIMSLVKHVRGFGPKAARPAKK